jgi:hypothetical protein
MPETIALSLHSLIFCLLKKRVGCARKFQLSANVLNLGTFTTTVFLALMEEELCAPQLITVSIQDRSIMVSGMLRVRQNLVQTLAVAKNQEAWKVAMVLLAQMDK